MAYVNKIRAGMTPAQYYAAENRGKVYDIRDAGAYVDGSHDDTQAVQDTINEAAANFGGVVLIPDTGSACIINGALVRDMGGSVDPKSQLYIPQKNYTDGDRYTIEIRGENVPNCTQSNVLSPVVAPVRGSILRSTIENNVDDAYIIGTKGAAANYATNNYNNFAVRNLQIQYTQNASDQNTIGGIDAHNCGGLLVENATIFPFNESLNVCNQPINSAIGINLPKVDGEIMSRVKGVSLGGFQSGIKTGDHGYLEDIGIFGCLNGIEVGQTNLMTTMIKMFTLGCKNQITFSGGLSIVNILSLMVENKTQSKWFDYDTTILDSSNYGRGVVNYSIWIDNAFANASFVKTGGSRLRAMPIGFLSGTGFTVTGSTDSQKIASLITILTDLGIIANGTT